MKNSRILLGVTGSIAAYKAAELVRSFVKENCSVRVIMTESATKFVSELTFRTLSQNKVYVEMFEDSADWCPDHITLSDNVDVFVIAPCTANVIAKIAHGISDDLLTATALACTAPMIIAPAMNEKMWQNTVTQHNVSLLRQRGVEVLDTDSGDLACGYEGKGRLIALESIISRSLELLEKS